MMSADGQSARFGKGLPQVCSGSGFTAARADFVGAVAHYRAGSRIVLRT